MVKPFNMERPGRIAIAIPGYDPRRQVEILGNKQRQRHKKVQPASKPVVKAEPVPAATASDDDIASLNMALSSTTCDPEYTKELQELFNNENEANATNT